MTEHQARATRILLAEDEHNVRRVISAHLRRAGYEVLEAADVARACQAFSSQPVSLVITDLKMPHSERDGFEVLRYVIEHAPPDQPRIPVLILTAHGTADKAIDALAQGAYNLISKPCDMRELLAQVQNALRERDAMLEAFSQEVASEGRFGLIGQTPTLLKIFDTIATVADRPTTVLVSGESGTGKELVARALHHHSSRIKSPFIQINCAAIPESLIESELFGHEKGAFTGAVQTRIGRLEQAHTGTLFLDEIGEIRPDIQVKLLRCLQEQCFERVGGTRTIHVDIRVIAATNRDLAALVRSGQFREDLFYRLNVVPVNLPPLRERRDDIPLLIEHFLQKHNRRLDRNVSGVDRTLLEILLRYPWPGNIRELENVMEHMLVFSDSAMLGIRHLPDWILRAVRSSDSDSSPSPPLPFPAQPQAGVQPDDGTSRAAAALPTASSSLPHAPQEDAADLELEPPAEALSASAEGRSGAGLPDRIGLLPRVLSLKDMVREETARLEREVILKVLDDLQWNVTKSAERLGLSRKGLQVKMKELDIRKTRGFSS